MFADSKRHDKKNKNENVVFGVRAMDAVGIGDTCSHRHGTVAEGLDPHRLRMSCCEGPKEVMRAIQEGVKTKVMLAEARQSLAQGSRELECWRCLAFLSETVIFQ